MKETGDGNRLGVAESYSGVCMYRQQTRFDAIQVSEDDSHLYATLEGVLSRLSDGRTGRDRCHTDPLAGCLVCACDGRLVKLRHGCRRVRARWW